jgi:hypothetical protein
LENWFYQPLKLERNVSAQSDSFKFGIDSAISLFKPFDRVETPDITSPFVGREFTLSRLPIIIDLLYPGAVGNGISIKTVETHRSNVMQKLEIHNVSELVRYAVRNQIVEA